jgi:hypothetical protein
MRCEICELLRRLKLTESKDARSLFVCTCKQPHSANHAPAVAFAKAA